MEDPSLGWILKGNDKKLIAGTYLHGIFENGEWRRMWLNQIRAQKGLKSLSIERISSYLSWCSE